VHRKRKNQISLYALFVLSFFFSSIFWSILEELVCLHCMCECLYLNIVCSRLLMYRKGTYFSYLQYQGYQCFQLSCKILTFNHNYLSLASMFYKIIITVQHILYMYGRVIYIMRAREHGEYHVVFDILQIIN